jgi:hypothetical protein
MTKQAERSRAAARTFSFQGISPPGGRDVLWGRSKQESATEFQGFGAMTVCQESEVADFHKAVRQDMQQKPADKLDGAQGHGFLRVSVGRVPPAECHLTIRHSD